jgi:hypothetical protein
MGGGKSGTAVESVCVSACGNFGLVGDGEGTVKMWNMQSGLERKVFEVPEVVAGSSKGRAGGKKVVGIVTDPLNKLVVVGSMDGNLTVRPFPLSAFLSILVSFGAEADRFLSHSFPPVLRLPHRPSPERPRHQLHHHLPHPPSRQRPARRRLRRPLRSPHRHRDPSRRPRDDWLPRPNPRRCLLSRLPLAHYRLPRLHHPHVRHSLWLPCRRFQDLEHPD